MSGPLERLLQGVSLEATLYPPESRYYGVPVATYALPDGSTVRHLRRRQLPDPSTLTPIGEYRVVDRDRMDNLAARFLGDPLAAWRVADANVVLRMETLVEETGRRIVITMPQGAQGPSS